MNHSTIKIKHPQRWGHKKNNGIHDENSIEGLGHDAIVRSRVALAARPKNLNGGKE
jgi:hypothetical protein